MRLIDADRLDEVIERNFCYPGCLKQIVDAQPTVYHASKIIELLEVNSEYVQGSVEPYVRLADVIEIVKSGIEGRTREDKI